MRPIDRQEPRVEVGDGGETFPVVDGDRPMGRAQHPIAPQPLPGAVDVHRRQSGGVADLAWVTGKLARHVNSGFGSS